ncbi:uncharacterized protein ACO6RY_06967 [Pungitius sinensis]
MGATRIPLLPVKLLPRPLLSGRDAARDIRFRHHADGSQPLRSRSGNTCASAPFPAASYEPEVQLVSRPLNPIQRLSFIKSRPSCGERRNKHFNGILHKNDPDLLSQQ